LSRARVRAIKLLEGAQEIDMNKMLLGSALVLGFALACTGCASREVTVTGETKSAATVSGPITLEFFEIPSEEGEEATSISKVTLDKLGAFTQTIEIDGDKVRILALDDTDKNGACAQGELWAQVDAEVKDDKVEGVTLDLKAASCPTVDAESK
jgi:hypothetical protein